MSGHCIYPGRTLSGAAELLWLNELLLYYNSMKPTPFIFGLLLLSGFASTALAVETTAQATSTPAQTVEETVRDYFADIPVMIEIARCESKFRQFADSGNVLRGGVGGQMVGVFQFFDRYHTSPAYERGFDIETLEGNLAYARYTYEREGTTPWNSARACWDIPSVSTAKTVAVSDAELRKQIALLKQIIELLQTILSLQQGRV